MSDTDSQMMRRQQAMDVRETIAEDETEPRSEAHDSDPESASAREAAQAGGVVYAREQQDEILAQNRSSDYAAEAAVFEDGDVHPHGKPPLAIRDRSLLGD